MNRHRLSLLLFAAAALLAVGLGPGRAADGSAVRQIGDYAIHYNAMPAAQLDPGLAARYGLPRGGDRCVVTVAVVHRETGAMVEAGIMGSATRPDGRMHHLELRRVQDEGGVYYVAALPLESSARLEFKLEVRPQPSVPPQTIRFSRSFTQP